MPGTPVASRFAAELRVGIALGVEEHGQRRRKRGLFAEIEEEIAAIGEVNCHEAAAAEIAAAGMDHSKGIADGHRRIDGIATLLQDGEADFGGEMLGGDNHRMLGGDR